MALFNKNNEPRPTTAMMLIIRVAVGGYLEYLAFSLKDSIEMPINSSNLFILIATIVFFIAGLIFIAFPLRDLLQGRYEGGINDPMAGEADADVEEAATVNEETEETEETEAIDDIKD